MLYRIGSISNLGIESQGLLPGETKNSSSLSVFKKKKKKKTKNLIP